VGFEAIRDDFMGFKSWLCFFLKFEE